MNDNFMDGFYKQARIADWARGAASKLTNAFKSKSNQAVQSIATEAKKHEPVTSPFGNKLRKGLGYGILAAGGGLYGAHQLSKDPDEHMAPR